MSLKKGFLKNRVIVFQLNRTQVIIAFVLFILIAITFFNFLYVIRLLGISFDSLSNDFEPFYFTNIGEFYYSFLFAFISVFFSFSLIYNYWFEKPNKYLNRHNYKRKFALNQQRTLNWFFIYWFFKLAFVFGVFTNFFNDLDIYVEYKPIVIVFIIAFIGQIWISIRPLIKKNKFKWFLIVVFASLFFSFIVSKINIINPTKIQNMLVQKNLMFKHNVHILKSKVGTKIKQNYLSCDIIITNNNVMFFKGEKINKDELYSKILQFNSQFSEYEVPYLRYILFIDRNIKMEDVFSIKKKLNDLNIKRIVFSTKAIKDKKPFYYKSNLGLGIYLPNNFIDKKDRNIKKEVEIKILNKNNYLFINDTISERNLTKKIKVYFQKEGTKSIRILFNKENTFEDYFRVLEHSKEAVNQLRNIYSKKAYGVDFRKLNRVQNKPIKEKYRWHTIDEMY